MPPVPENKENKHPENLSAVESPQFIVMQSSSDSEDEPEESGGYQLLSQDPDDQLTNQNLPAVSHYDEDEEEKEQEIQDGGGASGGLDAVIMQQMESNDFTYLANKSNPYQTESDVGWANFSEEQSVWNGPNETHLPMDKEHIDQIKNVMSSFSLPITSQPQWAKEIPEEEWKANLVAKLQTRTFDRHKPLHNDDSAS